MWIVACLEDGANPTRSAGVVDLPGGAEHAAGGARARARLDPDDAAHHLREGSRRRDGHPAGYHSYAILPIGYPMGRFGPVGRGPLSEVVYLDGWGKPYPGI